MKRLFESELVNEYSAELDEMRENKIICLKLR